MSGRQNIEQIVQIGFSVQRQQTVHLTDIAVLRRITLIHIKDKGFQQIHFAAVPEVVALAGTVGVLDDDIHKELGHQFLPFHFGKAVPAVRVFREYQIEHLDTVALIAQVLAGFFVELAFGVRNDQGFPANHRLKDAVHTEGAGFHAATGAVYGQIAVDFGIFRDADRFPI